MPFFVYLLLCADGSYYTGQTDDLEQRIAMHHAGFGGVYTHGRRPLTLAWQSDFPSRAEAIAAERQIKGWSRAKKGALVGSDWETISALARSGASTGSARTDEGAEPTSPAPPTTSNRSP